MKIDTEVMENFLNKVRMNEVETCLLKFQDEGLVIASVTDSQTCKCDGVLYKSAFKEYEAIGNIGVDELSKLIKVFKRLGSELEFKVEGNLLTAKGNNKELSVEMMDEKFIDEPEEYQPIEETTQFKLSAETLNNFIKDVQMNSDAAIYFETVNNGVKLYNDGKYKFKYNVDSEGTEQGVKLKFGEPLIKALNNISNGEILCKVKTDMPMIVQYETEQYKLQFLIAPRTDNDE